MKVQFNSALEPFFCRRKLGDVTPQAALQAQIERYRAMTREQRAGIALRLHEMACEMARLGIRRQHPGASPEEINHLLKQRIALSQISDRTRVAAVTADLQNALSGRLLPKQT
jgi:hypothetical protein